MKRAFGTVAVPVDATGHELLSRSAFTGYHHGGLGCRNLAHFLEDLLHALPTPYDTFCIIRAVEQVFV